MHTYVGGFWDNYEKTRSRLLFLKGREKGHQMLHKREWGAREHRKRQLWRIRREVYM